MIKTKSTQVSGRRASRASEARVASWQPLVIIQDVLMMQS